MKFSSKVILGALILVGAFLRIYNVNFHCLWTEEVFTLNLAKQPLLQILSNQDFTSPLFYILAHISYIIFGSDASIRYPSVIFGILLIPMMYSLGETYRCETTGLYMAMLSVVILPFEYYSQYGRSYELSILAFVVLLILYIRVKRGENIELLFWITALTNLYIHLFSLIPISILCLDLIIERHQRIFYAILMFLASLPLIGTIYQVITQRTISAGVNYGASMLQMIILIPLEFFNALFLNIIVLSCAGIKMDKDPLKWRILLVATVTLVAGAVLSNFTPIFPRYLMGASIIILLFAATACVDLSKIIKVPHCEMVVFIIITLIFAWMALPNFESHFWVEQYVC